MEAPRKRSSLFLRRTKSSRSVTTTPPRGGMASASLAKGYCLENGKIHLIHHSTSLASTTLGESSDSLVDSHSDPTSTNTNGTVWLPESIETTVRLWKLNDTERERLVQLGKRLTDIRYPPMNNPDTVLRFLTAKSGDLKAAEHMFRASVAWRRSVPTDTILNRPPPQELIDAIPGAIIKGSDLDGDPIFVSRVGTFDVMEGYKRFGRETIIHHCIWIRELASRGEWRTQREAEMGRPLKQILIIEDLHGLPLTKLIGNPQILSMYGEMMKIDQENYPDVSKKIVILRTPALFRMIWKLVKPFFDKYVVEKMEFSGYNDCEEVLSKYVDLSVLPPDLLPGIGKGSAEAGMPLRFDGGHKTR